jgi:predicted nucleic acid-binding protein
MLVLDANILIRAVLGRRVRQLLETYTGRGVRFYAPDDAYADDETYFRLYWRSVENRIKIW